jgi:hypothetical protein
MRIGHALLLTSLGSPLAPPNPQSSLATIYDTCLALYVLSRPWRAAARGLRGRHFRWLVRAWAWQIRTFRKINLQTASNAIADYVRRAAAGPRSWHRSGPEDRTWACPWICVLVTHRMECFHQSDATIMDTPLSRAMWELKAWSEVHDGDALVSDEELSLREQRDAAGVARSSTCDARPSPNGLHSAN